MDTSYTAAEDGAPAALSRPALNARQRFLRHLGLQRDVFANPVAEQEYSFSTRPDPAVAAQSTAAPADGEPAVDEPATTAPEPLFSPRSFFVDPIYTGSDEGSILRDLRGPQHTFVFGRPGDGKTTVRLALEAHVRTQPQHTLLLTYEPGQTTTAPTLAVHLKGLVEQLAVDLFIQVVEQFVHRTRDPNKRQTEGMRWLLAWGGPQLARVLHQLATGQEPAGLWGFAELWPTLDRPIVRSVVRTKRLQHWLLDLDEGQATPAATRSPRQRWRRALGVARGWGYHQLIIAIDGVDTWQRTPQGMMGILDGLLAEAARFGEQGVYLKGFLPLELQPAVAARMAQVNPAEGWRSLTLGWPAERLAEMLYARFRAGGAGRLGLDDLVEPELEPGIDERLIAAADGSPRRLLTLIDHLINVHVSRYPLEQAITVGECYEASRRTDALLGPGRPIWPKPTGHMAKSHVIGVKPPNFKGLTM